MSHRVPDLELNLFAIDVNHASPKLYPDSEVVNRLKSLVSELQEETTFACRQMLEWRNKNKLRWPTDAGVSDDNVFEEVGIRRHAKG